MEPTIPQNEKLEESQAQNDAGGFTWKVKDIDRFHRFLCLGCEGNTYYCNEKKLTEENAECVSRLIKDGKGETVVSDIKSFSVSGRCAKQNSTIFALAFCARQSTDAQTKAKAYEVLQDVCRIPTHLFTFVEYCETLSKGTGWGRAHRRAVSRWYNHFAKDTRTLANHVTKYQKRNGWSHKDLLRLCHVKPATNEVQAVIRYVTKGLEVAKATFEMAESPEMAATMSFLQGVEEAKKAQNEDELVQLIETHNLVREHVPTRFLNHVGVWRKLLVKMPLTAMIRNLGKMSSIGLLAESSEEETHVVAKLSSDKALRAAKIHPFNVLVAAKTYSSGKGEKGKLRWRVNANIVKAMDNAFYKCFAYVEPTEKRFCLALDVSGSMGWGTVNGSGSITPRDAAAALAMVTFRSEQQCHLVGFSHRMTPINITHDMELSQVQSVIDKVPMGGTDCAEPMLWAQENNKQFDVFVVYTDCETWAGSIHPAEALRRYRRHSGIWNARLVVVAMTSNGFTLADPEDPGMLDMAGFDSAGPELLRQFALGDI